MRHEVVTASSCFTIHGCQYISVSLYRPKHYSLLSRVISALVPTVRFRGFSDVRSHAPPDEGDTFREMRRWAILSLCELRGVFDWLTFWAWVANNLKKVIPLCTDSIYSLHLSKTQSSNRLQRISGQIPHVSIHQKTKNRRTNTTTTDITTRSPTGEQRSQEIARKHTSHTQYRYNSVIDTSHVIDTVWITAHTVDPSVGTIV